MTRARLAIYRAIITTWVFLRRCELARRGGS